MVIMGRILSHREIEQIGAQAQARLAILPPPRAAELERVVESDRVVQVYRSFDDLYGRPILRLRVDTPREITRRGYAAVHYAFACLIVAAVLILILLVIVLNRTVLDPLARVTRHAVAIGEGADLSSRLDFKGKDEIGVLARGNSTGWWRTSCGSPTATR